MLKDILKNILAYHIDTFEYIKLINENGQIEAQSMDAAKSIIMNAKVKEPQTDFNGIVGLGDIGFLRGLVNSPIFGGADSKIIAHTKSVENQQIPEVLEFVEDSNTGMASATYRLMHSSIIPKVPIFNGVEWDIVMTPSAEKIANLAQLSSLMGDLEKYFVMKTKDDKLRVYIGDENAAAHKANFIFADDISVVFSHDIKWPLREVVKILKFASDNNMQMRISRKGVINITFENELINYDFFIIANQN